MIKSVKRTTEKLIGVRFIVSRPFHGLIESSPLAPTDESVGYCHPSASPTFAAKPAAIVLHAWKRGNFDRHYVATPGDEISPADALKPFPRPQQRK